jgi:hypothetical protein
VKVVVYPKTDIGAGKASRGRSFLLNRKLSQSSQLESQTRRKDHDSTQTHIYNPHQKREFILPKGETDQIHHYQKLVEARVKYMCFGFI